MYWSVPATTYSNQWLAMRGVWVRLPLWETINLRDPKWWAAYKAENDRRRADPNYWENIKKRSNRQWDKYLKDKRRTLLARRPQFPTTD